MDALTNSVQIWKLFQTASIFLVQPDPQDATDTIREVSKQKLFDLARMAERKMIIVLVYIDGRIQHGDKGVEYNIPPKITFPALEATTFEEVRNKIFQALGYTEDHCAMSIQARQGMEDDIREDVWAFGKGWLRCFFGAGSFGKGWLRCFFGARYHSFCRTCRIHFSP
uniref:Uncharacterized protein n=1 Tax=Oryza glumipatula TaxID=40148 RepID=A0A0E0BAY2_9ORYZ